MTERNVACDFERLRLLLANEMPPELEEETANHVAACADCRRKLEALAGDQDWWAEVKSSFSNNAGFFTADQSSDVSHASDISDHVGAGSALAADFAVEFLEPCEQPESLGRLDEIEILEVIGRGGMGIILKGYQRELGRYVAVKVMAPHLAASGSARQRFAREARAAAAIVHPHVMAIHSVKGAGRLPYLVMPFVACESLQQRLDRDGPLDLKEILRIGRQVAAGLAAAHSQGLVHRDIKPANVLLETGVDRVMLTDFGLARAVDDASVTRTGVIAGTPQFMSPEQARGDPVGAGSDLFSLGGVFYAMCTGRPPFRAETSYGVLRRITDTQPRSIREINPDIPDWLVAMVGKLQEKDPEVRFQSAAELAELLEGCLAHVHQPTVVPLPEKVRRFVKEASPTLDEHKPEVLAQLTQAAKQTVAAFRRHPVRAAILVAGLLVLGTLIGVAAKKRPATEGLPPSDAREQAELSRDNTEKDTGKTPLNDSPPSAVWQDDIEDEIVELDHNLEAIEERVGRPWETDPVQRK
jgi:serine/threonine-protein kinase